MASVQLQVNVARGQLDTLIADVNKLGSKSIKFNVDASGFQALEASVLKTINAQTRYNNSVARVKESQNAVAIAQQKTAQTANMVQVAQAKLATQVEKTGTAQVQYASQIEKTATAQANLATQQEKTATAAVNYETQVEKTATASQKASGETKKYGESLKQTGKDTKELTGLSKILGDSLGNIAAKIVTWQVVNGAVATMIRSFKDAVTTMKAVDDELVTVRKVTGATAGEMKQIEKQAYATASAYGVAADQYLESVAAFARAGYGDQAEALAELSTKTQIVGDTTAEVANQFLLAVDAAYQYKGNIESLTHVLDGANEIDNHYATSIEKIAEGLGKVAPIAAQTHVGVNELTAAIGTITAVTQRSGTEAATALRALLLNIVGDTKTEIEEGVTWTTGEIAGLTDVIKKYAPAAYEAAQATGEVIDPMEAIGGLAQSMKDGLLTEQELMIMVSDIGGKLRTPQLLALLQNWDMYKSMLEDFGDSAGSADAEVSNALDSWTRKTMQLKNTWTEFLTNFINSDTVKGGLDILIAAVDSLNGGFGEFAATTVIVFGAFKMLNGAVGALSPVVMLLQTKFFGLNAAAIAAANGMEVAEVEAQIAAAKVNAAMGIIAIAVSAALMLISGARDKVEQERQDAIDAAKDAVSATKNIEELTKTYETAESGSDAATQAANDLTAALEAQGIAVNNLKNDYANLAEEQKKQALRDVEAGIKGAGESLMSTANYNVAQMQEALDILGGGEAYGKFTTLLSGISNKVIGTVGDIGGINVAENYYGGVEGILNLYDAVIERKKEIAPDSEEYAALDKFVNALKSEVEQYRELIQAKKDIDGTTKAEQDAVIMQTANLIKNNAALQEYGKIIAEVAGKTDEASKEKFASAIDSIETLTSAMVENGEISQEVADSVVDYYEKVGQIENPTYAAAAASGELISALVDESGQLTDTAVQALSTNSALLAVASAEAQAQAAAARANYSNLINQLGAVASEAIRAANALAMVGMGNAKTMLASAMKANSAANTPSWMPQSNVIDKFRPSTTYPAAESALEAYAEQTLNDINAANAEVKYWKDFSNRLDALQSGENGGGAGGGGGGGGGGSSEDRFLAALEDEIDLLKSELALMKERGASEEDQIKKIQQIQDALHLEADYLRQIGASQADINKLSKEWWSYQDEIYDIRLDLLKSELALMEEREDDTDTQIAKTKEIQALLREQIDNLKKIGASQTEINKLEKEWWEHENEVADKTNKLAEDRLSLEEKILAVQEAQVALMNAQNERTVRMYNAATGQWEWTANPKDIKNAEESLEDAKKDLADFYNDHKELRPEADEMGAGEILAGLAESIPEDMISDVIGTSDSRPGTSKDAQRALSKVGAGATAIVQSNIGTQNNGNVYYFGGISFTEAQAETMTIKQLAQQSRSLNIYSGAN